MYGFLLHTVSECLMCDLHSASFLFYTVLLHNVFIQSSGTCDTYIIMHVKEKTLSCGFGEREILPVHKLLAEIW